MVNGVSIDGFTRKRLDEILSDKNTAVQSVLGSNLNLSPESPDGQINGVYSESDANLWELAEACYNAFAPAKATGNTLSDLVKINGITREPAVASTVSLTISGTPSTNIPIGSLVSTSDGSTAFSTDVAAIIGGGGTVVVQATATLTGPLEASAGTVTVIDSPITGWLSVTNIADAVIGQNEETDAELRIRRELSVSKPAKAIVETILAEILEVDGVVEAFVFENDSSLVDPETGTPANQFQSVVLGGDDTNIAEAIFNEKPVGIASFGTTTVAVTDSQGFNHDINFTRPTQITIYIIVNLTINSNYPSEGDDNIKQSIVDYADGLLVSGRGFGVGDNIIHSELYTPINLTPGHTVDSLFIGTSPAPAGASDLIIDFDQVSEFIIGNITVNS